VGGLPRTRRRSIHASRNLSRAPAASLRDRLRRPWTEPDCRQIRQQSGSGEGSEQDASTTARVRRRGLDGGNEARAPKIPVVLAALRRRRVSRTRTRRTCRCSGKSLPSRHWGRAASQRRGVARVVPDVPAQVPVAVGLGAGAVPGVDLDVAVGAEGIGGELEDVPGDVAQRPVGEADLFGEADL
jgi:hypothetical protein